MQQRVFQQHGLTATVSCVCTPKNAGSRPRASAFYGLPVLVCSRSEGPQSALGVDRHERPTADLCGLPSERQLASASQTSVRHVFGYMPCFSSIASSSHAKSSEPTHTLTICCHVTRLIRPGTRHADAAFLSCASAAPLNL
jgi:hypothetical protein